METRILIRSDPKPEASNFPPQLCSRWYLILMFESVDAWTYRQTRTQVPSFKLTRSLIKLLIKSYYRQTAKYLKNAFEKRKQFLYVNSLLFGVWIIELEEDIMVLNNVTKFHKILIKNMWLRERTSFQMVIFHKQRAITTESMVRYGPLSNLKKTSWYLTMWPSFIKF